MFTIPELGNFFPTGVIVSPNDLLERDNLLHEAKHTLLEGKNVLLRGLRRSGKSSVAHEILRQLKAEGCYVASVNLLFATTIEEFATKLLRSVLENRISELKRGQYAFKYWDELLIKDEFQAQIKELNLGVRLDFPTEPMELLDTAIEVADRLAFRDGKRMVVLVDELPELIWLFGETHLFEVRTAFEGHRNISYLFLGNDHPIVYMSWLNPCLGIGFYENIDEIRSVEIFTCYLI